MTDTRSPEKILQLGTAFWASKTMLSAVELGVFSILAKGPQNLDELTRATKLHTRSARDFFDTLVSLHMLERDGGQYRNTPEADLFLDRAKPSYVGGILEMMNARLYGFWGELTTALKTGLPQNETKSDPDMFEKLYNDPNKLKLFLKAMTGISTGTAIAIAHKFPWAKHRTFADVGGAQGAASVQIAMANKHLTGMNFDLAVVGPIYNEFVQSMGLSDRLSFRPGNFFNEQLPTADVLIMGHILHDWDLEQKKLLLKKAYDALPKGGALIVYEALIDDDRRTNTFGLLMSLNMLIETKGGYDYTGADCMGWMKEAGFSDMRMEHLVGPDSMVVGIK